MSEAADRVALLRQLLRLKATPRTGWLDRGVPRMETKSVADHILMTALTGWITADDDLDRDRVLKLALVHDLAEAITGDPPPYDRDDLPPANNIEAVTEFFSRRHTRAPENKTAKDAREATAIETLAVLMPDAVASEIDELWREYEAQKTPEAKYTKDLDRFEAFLQAREYMRQHPELPLSGFTLMAEQELQHPALIALRDAILADEDFET